MSDIPALPSPDPAPIDTGPTEIGPTTRRLDIVPVLILAGFLILAACVVWLFLRPPPPLPEPLVDPAQVTALQQQVAALQQRVQQQADALGQRITRVEQRPLPTMPDLKPLEAQIAALQQRPAPPPPPDLAPLEDRIAKLEQRPVVPPDMATKGDLQAFATRLDAVAGREDQLAARQQGLESNFGNKLDLLTTRTVDVEHQAAALPQLETQLTTTSKRIGEVEQSVGQVPALADKAVRIGRIQAAMSALANGLPVGDLPNAPPALTRFARTPPPTEAALRLAFPAAARAAERASRPSTEGQPFLDRMWLRAQDLVTLREGDRVIVGDPAAGIIARARRALAAGDLAGAVAAVGDLSGPAAQAMADWREQAKSLLDARAALAAMAGHA